MSIDKLIKNQTIFNGARNLLQFSVGTVLYIFFFQELFLIPFFLGLVGYLIAYSAVYYYNDIIDYKSDRKDKYKRIYKPLASGKVSFQRAVTLCFLCVLIGLFFSFSVGWIFGVLVSLLLFLNWSYSSKLKQTKLRVPLMFIIQFLKFSSGWVALTTNITLMPTWLLICLAGSYTLGFSIYKTKSTSKKMNIEKSTVVIFSIIVIVSYIISVLIYPFKLPLLLAMFLPFAYLILTKIKNFSYLFLTGMKLTLVTMFIFLLLFLLLANPTFNKINVELSEIIGNKKIPLEVHENLTAVLENINVSKIKTIEDFDLNKTLIVVITMNNTI